MLCMVLYIYLYTREDRKGKAGSGFRCWSSLTAIFLLFPCLGRGTCFLGPAGKGPSHVPPLLFMVEMFWETNVPNLNSNISSWLHGFDFEVCKRQDGYFIVVS